MADLCGFERVRRPENGADYSFRKDRREVNFYLNDGVWYIFCQSIDRQKTEDGYFVYESLGFTSDELKALSDEVIKLYAEDKECNA